MINEKEKRIKDKLSALYNKVIEREEDLGDFESPAYSNYAEKVFQFEKTLNKEQKKAFSQINSLALSCQEEFAEHTFILGFYEGIKYYKSKIIKQTQAENKR